jgi:hypothetical protein
MFTLRSSISLIYYYETPFSGSGFGAQDVRLSANQRDYVGAVNKGIGGAGGGSAVRGEGAANHRAVGGGGVANQGAGAGGFANHRAVGGGGVANQGAGAGGFGYQRVGGATAQGAGGSAAGTTPARSGLGRGTRHGMGNA